MQRRYEESARRTANQEDEENEPTCRIANEILQHEEDELQKLGPGRLLQIAKWMAEADILDSEFVDEMAEELS